MKIEIWADDMGLPVTKPEIICKTVDEAKDWLLYAVYINEQGKICGFGYSVRIDGRKVPFSELYTAEEIYTDEEWAHIIYKDDPVELEAQLKYIAYKKSSRTHY